MAFGSFIKNTTMDFVTSCTSWKSRAELIRENKYLRAKVKVLTAEVARLVAEVKDLKERLGLNSTNSSLPPSRDLYKITKQKSKSGRKQGAQPGHKGVGRKLVPISRVNHGSYAK